MIPTAKGYFSGGGGLELGVSMAGVKVIQSLEIDVTAANTLSRNLGHEVVTKDISKVTVLDQPKSDVVLGTFPCTKYSTIADIHGTRNGDDLYLHQFRHMALELPEMFVLENVPGMRKFPVVMEAMTKIPGYYVTVVCPVDAMNWLPQRRKRLIIFGTRKPFRISEPKQGRRPSIADILETDVDPFIPEYIRSRLNGKYRDKPIIVDADDPHALAPTCVAHYSKDRGTRMVKVNGSVRPFTTREYARLQGFPDWYELPQNDSAAYKIIGNAVPPPMGRWIGHQIMKYFN